MKKENEAIKDWVIIDVNNLFEHEEQDYYIPVFFAVTILLNMKVMVIEIKHYHLKNITKLDHT